MRREFQLNTKPLRTLFAKTGRLACSIHRDATIGRPQSPRSYLQMVPTGTKPLIGLISWSCKTKIHSGAPELLLYADLSANFLASSPQSWRPLWHNNNVVFMPPHVVGVHSEMSLGNQNRNHKVGSNRDFSDYKWKCNEVKWCTVL